MIVGGTDANVTKGDNGIYVSRVHEGGAASEAGLHQGDHILSIEGVSVRNITHDEAIAIMKEKIRATSLTLEVARTAGLEMIKVVDGKTAASDDRTIETQGKSRKELARSAFKTGDKDFSAMVHAQVGPGEQHQTEQGQYIKAMVFGGLDGIITTFAVVASASGANLSSGIVIIMGFSNLIADGISMGFGEYVSMQSEKEYVQSERNREEWEYDCNKDDEVTEMIDIYKEKGFTDDEASAILKTMASHKDFFIDHMMVQELGMMPNDPDDSPVKSGFIMFCSFLIFGLIPLLSYLVLSTIDFGSDETEADALFGIACGLTAVALFVLGAAKSKFSIQSWWKSGFWVFSNGAIAAAAAYIIGFALEKLVDAETECVNGTA